VVKGGIRERFARCEKWNQNRDDHGDNPLTPAAIAPKQASTISWRKRRRTKLKRIRRSSRGSLVADGDARMTHRHWRSRLGVAMKPALQAAEKPATWSISIRIQRNCRHRRDRYTDADHGGSLTTFSIANDVAEILRDYRMLMGTFPAIAPLNIMHLSTSTTAISAPSFSTRSLSSH